MTRQLARTGQLDGTSQVLEKPANGLAGLKHWPYDLRSGFMVAMISLPFSMGIAITSGAPPVCGIISAIIAGMVLPFLGGSYVTVSGPAAGLAPAIFAGMVTLGAGVLGPGATVEEKLRSGYPLILFAILLAGVCQMILARFQVARLSALFPSAAIHGMLAAIGLLIIVKQIPLFMDRSFEAHEFWDILEEVPQHLSMMNHEVFWLGAGCTVLLFVLNALPGRLLRIVPPSVWAIIVGTAISQVFLGLDEQSLIQVPEAPLANGIVLPDFVAFREHPRLWFPLAWTVVTIMLINGAESLATIAAVDRLDPFRRKSEPDRTLLAMGASNICSSMLGGLTVIPGIVKSTANILGGGRTQWANFYNACFLLVFITLGRDLINMVPRCVLASILFFVGFKLCRPLVWRAAARVGWEQFFIFSLTILVTVTTDLLIGLAVGVGLKYALSLWSHTLGLALKGPAVAEQGHFPMSAAAAELFRNPVTSRELLDGVYHLHCNRPMVCFNLFHLFRELDATPTTARSLMLHIGEGVTLIDHTTCENLLHAVHERDKQALEIAGLERMRPISNHASSTRLAYPASLPPPASAS